MAKWSVNIRLRAPNAKTAQAIHVVYRYDGKETRISCGFKCLPRNWNNVRREVKPVAGHPLHIADNARISATVSAITAIARRVEALGGDLTPKAIKNAYDLSIISVAEVASHDADRELAKWWLHWLRTGSKRESTIATYMQSRAHVLAFDPFVTWDKIDADWLTGFTAYAIGLGHSNNQIAKTRKNLKAVMRAAWDADKHANQNFRKSFFRFKFEVATDEIALVDAELKLIAKVDLSHNPKLHNARNLFLLNCWTGASFADNAMHSHKSIIISGDKSFIDYSRVKSGVEAMIPVHPSIAHIATSDAATWPRPISNQKQNLYIKEIALLAGIDPDKAAKVVTTTGRRSFVTFMQSQKIPNSLIMGMTGHKTEKALLGYSRFGALEKAEQLAEMDVFN